MAKKSVHTRLDTARADRTDTIKQIAELEAARDAALIDDDDVTAARLLGEIEAAHALERGYADKIKLLEREVKDAKQAGIVKERAAFFRRFEKLLCVDADTLAEEIQNDLDAFHKKVRKLIEKREAARAAYAVNSAGARAATQTFDGAALSAEAVMTLLSFESYRISADPLQGGRPGERRRPALPGAKSPRIELILQPGKILPFATALKRASEFAVKTLKAEIKAPGEFRSEPAPVGPNGGPAPPRDRSEAEERMRALLEQQYKLSLDVSAEGEAAYLACAAEIKILDSEIRAAREPENALPAAQTKSANMEKSA
jgi:hypothetical protein